MKLMEQHLDTRYGHIIISYEKNGQIRGFFLKISFLQCFHFLFNIFAFLMKQPIV